MATNEPPPRVMHLRSSCGLYGAEGVIRTLVYAYPGQSTVACLVDTRDPHGELSEILSAEGRSAITIPTRGAVDLGVLVRFAAAVRRCRPQVVHCHDYKSAAIAVLGGVGRRRGLVFTIHGDMRETVGSALLIRLGQWALKRFDAVVGVSEATASDALEYGVASDRIHLIRNAVDTQRFQPEGDRSAARAALGVPPDGILIGAVGRLSPEKGHAVLLEAVARLKVPWRLALIGDGPLDADLRAQASALGIADRTHFTGRVEAMERAYRALDIVALPSHREGLPLTVVEASASGLPVAASDVGDVARVVLEGVTGFLSPPGDASGLARSLERLVADGLLRESFGRAGRAHVAASFGAEAMAQAYEALYREAAIR